MISDHTFNTMHEREPRGGALDVHWPCIPVGHLAFETDGYFVNIHCLSA